MISLLALTSLQQGTIVKDDLLNHLAGKWHLTRVAGKKTTKITKSMATGEWVLQHHYMRISMKEIAKRLGYDAQVYITYEAPNKRFAIYWLDIFAGTWPGSIGYGERTGDSIVFTWKDTDGIIRNAFAWDAKKDIWTSTIDQTDKTGKWSNFCVDTYRR